MPRSRLLPATAVVACLAGSGCDYWRNLTGSKTPDRGTLHVYVTDEWTKEPLAEASCRPAGKEEAFTVGPDGVFARPDMPTGRFALSCSAPGYHDRGQEVDILPGGLHHYHVKLGRKADDWYPDHPGRWVGIRLADGSQRFPGRIQLGATPDADSAGFFTYEWSSTHHPSRTTDTAALWLNTPDLGGESGQVAFKVRVKAHLGGLSYLVDSLEETFEFVRNRKPAIKVDTLKGLNIKLGCLDDNYNYSVMLSATDPDGACRSFSIYSKGTTSSLGPVDIRMDSCPFQQVVKFRMAPLPDAPPDAAPLRRENVLHFKAIDDDGASVQDSLAFETFSNSRPKIAIAPVNPPELLYPFDTLSFRITASDQDGSLHGLTVDWDNEEEPYSFPLLYLSGVSSYDKQFHRIRWEKPGRHEIVATITDGCATVSDTLPVQIQVNRIPRITKNVLGFDPISGEYQIKVSVTDDDKIPGNDSIRFSVNWNTVKDGVTNLPTAQEIRDQVLGRAYPKDYPWDTAWIILTALDRYNGNAFDTVKVPRHVVLGLPPEASARRPED